MEALRLLGERIDDSRKTVVLLDEISWMGREIEREIADKVDAFPKRRGVSIRTARAHLCNSPPLSPPLGRYLLRNSDALQNWLRYRSALA